MADLTNDSDVLIIGAGLAGLACAVHLTEAGRRVTILEAGDGVGGRVRTDVVDGFVLDRGFQVLLTAYPEAKSILDYKALDLRPFAPGALIQIGAKRAKVVDPVRQFTSILSTAKAPIGTVLDKVRVALLRRELGRLDLSALWERPDITTLQYLREQKFSAQMIDRFFRPLFGGIFLDRDLLTSSRMFEFVMRMLADGENAIPAIGMQAIPNQLAARLPAGTIRLGCRVGAVADHAVTLLDLGTVEAKTIVIATEGSQAAKLLGDSTASGAPGVADPGSVPVSCVYFAAEQAPIDQPFIVLNGDGAAAGPVNNLCVPSLVSAAYAPRGRHLVSASVLGSHRAPDNASLEAAVTAQLKGWFGDQVTSWDHLRTYHVPHAQPRQAPPALSHIERSVRVRTGVYVCGDHRDQASIQGALTSGRRAAEAVLADAAL